MRSLVRGSHGEEKKASTQILVRGGKPVREMAKECPVRKENQENFVKSSKPKKDSNQRMGATERSKETQEERTIPLGHTGGPW